jgi:hypothetical protein
MQYKTKREQIKSFFEERILPSMYDRSISYDKTISIISYETNTTRKIVEEILTDFIKNGKLIEIRELRLPEEVIIKALSEKKKREEEIAKELKDAGLVDGSKNN